MSKYLSLPWFLLKSFGKMILYVAFAFYLFFVPFGGFLTTLAWSEKRGWFWDEQLLKENTGMFGGLTIIAIFLDIGLFFILAYPSGG